MERNTIGHIKFDEEAREGLVLALKIKAIAEYKDREYYIEKIKSGQLTEIERIEWNELVKFNWLIKYLR